MPELPEVQTVVDDLNRKIKGYQVVDFWTDWKKSVKMPLAKFKKEIKNKKVVKVERRAKNILIYLSGRDAISRVSMKIVLVHLKMTGHLLIKFLISNFQFPIKSKLPKIKYKKNNHFNERVNGYIHHIWFLKKGRQLKSLEFSDLRKFGKIEVFDANDLENRKDIQELGVEPLSKEFTFDKLKEILKRYPRRNIRMVLMDLKLIVGIGNIYASEIPFEARINPKRKAGKLTLEEISRLHKNITKVLKKALKMRGTSDSDYRDTTGAPGSFQKVLKVYNREGQCCKRKNCQGIIKREKIGQRSAFYCPKCQR